MEKVKGRGLRNVYGVLFALLTLFLGFLFVRQVWSIYRSASEKPFTAATISAHFQEIAPFVWAWIAALAGNLLLALIFPAKEKAPKAFVDEKIKLQRAQKRLPQEEEYWEEISAISKKQRGLRTFVGVLCTLIMLLATALGVAVLLDVVYKPFIDKEFFVAHNGLVDRLVQVCTLAVISLLFAAICVGIIVKSRQKEQKKYLQLIAKSKLPKEEEAVAQAEESQKENAPNWEGVTDLVVKTLFFDEGKTGEEFDEAMVKAFGLLEEVDPAQVCVEGKKKPVKRVKKPKVLSSKEKKTKKQRKAGVVILRVVLAAAGVALVVFGVYNGGMADVLAKAINICTQCIGLG